jgi:periplasmic divalent cation tolerance protein
MVEYEYIVVLITTGSQEEARRIGDALISQKKAACVNIVPQINSLFWWEGKVEDDRESLLLVKTRAELFTEVVNAVKSIHSYDMPEIIALPIVKGSQDYLKWIGEETKAK